MDSLSDGLAELLLKKDEFQKDITVFRKLGGGSFGIAYLCHVQGVVGILVLKVVKDPYLDDKSLKELVSRDSLKIPFHPNVVSVLYHSDVKKNFHIRKFPDYDSFWKERIDGEDSINTGLVFMKFYRNDLERYLFARVKKDSLFSMLELCRILGGLLEGVKHLQKYRIIHRDLKLDNVFVDPLYGRVYIGDFGMCVDNRHTPEEQGFNVNPKDYTGGNGCFYKGGKEEFLPPEVVDFVVTESDSNDEEDENEGEDNGEEEDEEVSFIDYSKCDVFSVGMIAYYLIETFNVGVGDLEEYYCAAFGTFTDSFGIQPITKNRKQEDYVVLSDELVDNGLARWIGMLLRVDFENRMGCIQAIEELKKLKNQFEAEAGKNMDDLKLFQENVSEEIQPMFVLGKRYGIVNAEEPEIDLWRDEK